MLPIAGLYLNYFSIPEAIKLLEKSLNITSILYEKDQSTWVYLHLKSLNNLSDAFKDNNQLNKAIKLEKKALKIIENLNIAHQSELADLYIRILTNLAYSYK